MNFSYKASELHESVWNKLQDQVKCYIEENLSDDMSEFYEPLEYPHWYLEGAWEHPTFQYDSADLTLTSWVSAVDAMTDDMEGNRFAEFLKERIQDLLNAVAAEVVLEHQQELNAELAEVLEDARLAG